jgi:hypothetical protein
MGVITFTCSKCKNSWTGGMGQEPIDPSRPKPPLAPSDRPDVDFYKKGTKEDEILEQRNPRNPTQTFRRGAPIPDGEE